jgi:hypothetical protein
MKELIVLTADKSIQLTIRALLDRPEALGIRPLERNSYDIVVHPQHDASVYLVAHEFLRPQASRYRRALTISDRHGSGRSGKTREEMESSIEHHLSQSGWDDGCAAVIIDPELEVWVWSDSPHVDAAVGWEGRSPGLKDWLIRKGYLAEGETKPVHPEKCLDETLRLARKPRSSALFQTLAQKVSLKRCGDPAFRKLRDVLRGWFPLVESEGHG